MQAKRLSVQLRTRPRGDGATTHLVPAPPWWPTWSCEPRGDTRTSRRADGSGAGARKTASPAGALGPSPGARIGSSAWRGWGTAGSHRWPLLDTSAPSSPPGPQSAAKNDRSGATCRPLCSQRGRLPLHLHKCPNNPLGPEAGNTGDKCYGQRKVRSVGVPLTLVEKVVLGCWEP